MSQKIDKNEAKSPDQVLKSLNSGFEWTRTHSKIFFGTLGAVIVLGLIVTLVDYLSNKKESDLQAQYYSIEKNYLDKKRDFTEAARDEKSKKPKASGDLSKDYGAEVEEFQKLLSLAGPTKAGAMAALNLSEIYINYKMLDQAEKALEQVGAKGSGLLSSLVQFQLGNLAEAKGDCKKAIGFWSKLQGEKSLSYMSSELNLRLGLCYEATQDLAKAETFYTEAAKKSEGGNEDAAGKEAEKYLRLLKMKKAL